jgi:DNA-binding NarL/FixJ family response regulator
MDYALFQLEDGFRRASPGDSLGVMKSKQRSKPRSGNGKATLKLAPQARPRRTPWRPASATLIAKSDGPLIELATTDVKTTAHPVILIEDNRLLLEGLSAMLSAQGLKVVATARTGAEALRHVARHRPHLVLLDATLGDRDSLTLVTSVKKVFPDIKVIVMHLLPSQEDVIAFVRAGVSGFIMKDASLADFVSTIRAVADGDNVLPPVITGTLFSHVADQAATGKKAALKAALRMTAPERDVMALIADGLGNREIAGRLGVQSHTVKSHLHNILEKLALHTRLEIAGSDGDGRADGDGRGRLRPV